MTPIRPLRIHKKNTVLVVRAKDLFPTIPRCHDDDGNERKARRVIPSRNQVISLTLSSGIEVKVLQYHDGTFWAVLRENHIYQLIPEILPIPPQWKRQHNPPVSFSFLDTLGNKVRALYMCDGKVGSRFEIAATDYVSDCLAPDQRGIRHREKLAAKYPLQAADILNWRYDLKHLLRRRPFHMWRKKWIAEVLRARMRGDDKERIESEITATITEMLYRPKTKRMSSNFYRTLLPLNRLRRLLMTKQNAEPLPIANYKWIEE
jgi:hypothetical protein